MSPHRAALIAKFDRVASLRQVSPGQLGKILYGNGRVRAGLVAGNVTHNRTEDMERRLDKLEAELLELIQRGEPVSQRGRPKKRAA